MKDKELSLRREKLNLLYSYLPPTVARELRAVEESCLDFLPGISEVRLRLSGLSEAIVSGRSIPLIATVTEADINECVYRLTDGSTYAYRDTLAHGYISLPRGIRVGVSGTARYDGERLVGVVGISSLIFRLPAARSSLAEDVYSRWLDGGCPNTVVAAPPLGGKTTLLAALAALIGRSRRVVIVDERCEFDPENYRRVSVDILSGYRREVGIEQATRTMSPEVIIADEIVTEREARAVASALWSGVRVITSVHAGSFAELYRRECMRLLFERGAFGMAVLIERNAGEFTSTVRLLDGELVGV